MAKETTTIDKDLYEGLQQARKKKPRYYALIAKGADVVGLIVQKKVINDGAVQKAKSESKGTLVVRGVCQGEGVELKLEVVDAEPSIAPKKIKDFIADQTELALKPQWAVVPQLTAVQNEETQPPEIDATPHVAQGEGENTASDLMAEWKEKVAAWSPTIKAALAAKGPTVAEIAQLLAQASAHSKPGGGMPQAIARLIECHDLAIAALGNLGQTQGTGQNAEQLPNQNQATGPSALFNERLKGLMPAIKAAAGTPTGDEAKLKASEAGLFARKQDFAQANSLLDQAQAAVNGSTANTSTSQNESSATSTAPTDISPGLFAKRKFLLERWQRIPDEVRADLKKLQVAIERELPEEDAELLRELSEDYLDEFYGEMKEAIDDDINAGDAQYKSAIGKIAAFRAEIADEPLIQHLKKCALEVDLTVESIMLGALAEVEQALAH